MADTAATPPSAIAMKQPPPPPSPHAFGTSQVAGPAAPHWPEDARKGAGAAGGMGVTGPGGPRTRRAPRTAAEAEAAAKALLEVPLADKWGKYRQVVAVQTESQELMQVRPRQHHN